MKILPISKQQIEEVAFSINEIRKTIYTMNDSNYTGSVKLPSCHVDVIYGEEDRFVFNYIEDARVELNRELKKVDKYMYKLDMYTGYYKKEARIRFLKLKQIKEKEYEDTDIIE